MRQLGTVTLDRFNDTPVDKPVEFEVVTPGGRLLGYEDVVGSVPALTSRYNGLSSTQLVLQAEDGLPFWDEATAYPVGRRDSLHGRNLEVMAGRVLISDAFGNIFKSLSIKGSNYIDPHLFESITASREYMVFGLQESLVIERVLRASQMLRHAGVHTEYICGVALPTEHPVSDNKVGIDRHTVKSLSELVEHVSSRYAGENPDPDKTALQIKSEMVERFGDCEYMVTFRGLDSPFRARDIADHNTFEEIKQFVIENYPLMGKELSEAEYSQARFLTEIWATQVGYNVALMHNLGLVHGYLTEGNITALGSIIDLDSVKGKPLGIGDDAITYEQKNDDVFSVIQTIRNIGDAIGDELTVDIEGIESTFDKQRIVVAEVFRTFFYQYFKNIELEGDKLQTYASAILMSAAEELKQDRTLAYLVYGVIAAYTDIRGDYDHLEKPLQLPERDTVTDKSLGQILEEFPFLPPIFYQREKANITDALSHVKENVLSGENINQFPRLPNLINLVTRRRFLRLFEQDTEALDPENFMAAASFLVFVPKSDEHRNNTNATHSYLEGMIEHTLDFLSEENQSVMPANLDAYLHVHGIDDYSNVGYLESTALDEPIPVFYVDGADDVKEMLANLNIDESLVEFDATIPSDLGDMIVIADYRLISESHLLHLTERSYMQAVILSDMFKNFMPSIIISNISSGKPKVTVIADPSKAHKIGLTNVVHTQIPIFDSDITGNQKPDKKETFNRYFWKYAAIK